MRYLTLVLSTLALTACNQHTQTANKHAQNSFDYSAFNKCIPYIMKDSEEHMSSIDVAVEHYNARSSGKLFEYMSEKAKEGAPYGQFSLGLMYFEGSDGVKKNKVKGLRWLSRAADNGSKSAKCFLGPM